MPTLMHKSKLELPSAEAIKGHVIASLQRYWFFGATSLHELPIHRQSKFTIELPLRLTAIRLPDWASAYGVNGEILIPQEICPENKDWRLVDWWLASFLFLEGWHERVLEGDFGPIHSYSLRLKGWDERAWQHAWVNRMALFLRIWVAQNKNISESQLFGPLPKFEFLLTHDVDAIKKTVSIRLKQGIFNFFNACRTAFNGEFRLALNHMKSALRFFFGQEDWWMLDKMLEIEILKNIRARYHFYSSSDQKNFKQWLFDPGYDINQKKLLGFMDRLQKLGGEIGLHTSFDSWNSSHLIEREKEYLQSIIKTPIISCRQHWLRFSWAETWKAQTEAGIVEDTTLMFNDRPGFRNAAAVKWSPWNVEYQCVNSIEALPTIIMDSHFYDYQSIRGRSNCLNMQHWLEECKQVRGQVAVLWHPHTLAKDYGWDAGFDQLISFIAES